MYRLNQSLPENKSIFKSSLPPETTEKSMPQAFKAILKGQYPPSTLSRGSIVYVLERSRYQTPHFRSTLYLILDQKRTKGSLRPLYNQHL